MASNDKRPSKELDAKQLLDSREEPIVSTGCY